MEERWAVNKDARSFGNQECNSICQVLWSKIVFSFLGHVQQNIKYLY